MVHLNLLIDRESGPQVIRSYLDGLKPTSSMLMEDPLDFPIFNLFLVFFEDVPSSEFQGCASSHGLLVARVEGHSTKWHDQLNTLRFGT